MLQVGAAGPSQASAEHCLCQPVLLQARSAVDLHPSAAGSDRSIASGDSAGGYSERAATGACASLGFAIAGAATIAAAANARTGRPIAPWSHELTTREGRGYSYCQCLGLRPSSQRVGPASLQSSGSEVGKPSLTAYHPITATTTVG